jgi:hypothetical protein
MRRRVIAALIGLAVALVAAQLAAPERSNPPVEVEVPAPPEVREVLRRSCYDCHSNETVWPWYSRVAPVSWLLAHDVNEGREYVNYSTWNRLPPEKQAEMIHESWEHVAEGDMPPWQYLPLHRRARLGEEDRALLRAWAGSMGESEVAEREQR